MTPPARGSSPPEDLLTIVGLPAIITELRAQIAVVVARVAELERWLGLHSNNRGKPPCTSSLSEPSNKTTGGQPGRPAA